MTKKLTQNNLNLARMVIEQTGHELAKWQECDFLWEYTAKCRTCGREYGVHVHFSSDFIDGDKNDPHPKQIWIYQLHYKRLPNEKIQNIRIAKICLQIQPLTCTELSIQDVIR